MNVYGCPCWTRESTTAANCPCCGMETSVPHSHPGPERAVDRFTPFYGHHPEGVHVKSSDYDALEAKYARLVEAARRLLAVHAGLIWPPTHYDVNKGAHDDLAAALGEEGK